MSYTQRISTARFSANTEDRSALVDSLSALLDEVSTHAYELTSCRNNIETDQRLFYNERLSLVPAAYREQLDALVQGDAFDDAEDADEINNQISAYYKLPKLSVNGGIAIQIEYDSEETCYDYTELLLALLLPFSGDRYAKQDIITIDSREGTTVQTLCLLPDGEFYTFDELVSHLPR